jgi:hypothetical protein
MPNWLLPLGALIILLGFLYFVFVYTKRAPPSDNPERTNNVGNDY